jgi:conflict system STAND superfamily ATPase
MSAPSPRRPYKYFDFYQEKDSDLFFGRKHEIETLLADIVSARLVVLFAKTGTGKSSLIHAGVRPRLHKLGYETLLTRVERDPAASLATVLRAEGLLAPDEQKPCAEMLIDAVKSRSKPLVVFIDQFEEFFLSVSDDAQNALVTQVGILNRTPRSGVHLVFSLREDYLADMDVFRDEIPTIFQKESQLRLRPFTAEQASEAIGGPTRVAEPPFRYDDGLIDTIVEDLPRDDGLILPVGLQIVCDTLWAAATAGVVTRDTYTKLGGARGILAARVTEDIGKLDAPSLVALEKMIPHLRTEDWTKQPRTLSELRSLAGIDTTALNVVTDALVQLHLLRKDQRESETVVEWVSDYVSHSSKALVPTLMLLWLRKMRARPEEPLPPERIGKLLEQPGLASRFTAEDWQHLLRVCAKNRDNLGLWYQCATTHAQDVWAMLANALTVFAPSSDEALRVILFLGEFSDDRAVKLLAKEATHSDRARARVALRALGATRSPRALEYLKPALEIPELSAAALDALQTLGQKDALDLAEAARKQSRSWKDLLTFPSRAKQLTGMVDRSWASLVPSTASGNSALLIGPGVGTYRTALAQRLAHEFHYPFSATDDLEDVLEFLSVGFGASWQKALTHAPPQVEEPDPALAVLSALPFVAYWTTDPTPELSIALVKAGKTPQEETDPTRPIVGSPASPLVLCLNGSIRNPGSIHRRSLGGVAQQMRKAFQPGMTVVAVGFDDHWQADEFRRGLVSDTRELDEPTNLVAAPLVCVLPPPEIGRGSESRADEYVQQYLRFRQTSFFWGTPGEFANELKTRLLRASR